MKKQIYKITFPTNKIYIGKGVNGHPLNFDIEDDARLNADFALLPKRLQHNWTLRKEILWESDSCSDEVLSQKVVDFINDYQSNDPAIGYNLSPAFQPGNNVSGAWSIGIDGCKGGWFYAASNTQQHNIGVVATLNELLELFEPIRLIIIDIPIGLYNAGSAPRQCDVQARKLLKPRGSTVFPAPVRPCLVAGSYAQACEISEKLTGKKLSQQAYHIFGKIKEVDELLRSQPCLAEIIREAHPELGFCMLNQGTPLLTSKKEPNGIKERLDLLRQRLPITSALYEQALNQFARKVLARDDIVDALMCLCIANAPLPEQIPTSVELDPEGLPMAMRFIS